MATYGKTSIGGSTWDCEGDFIGIDVTVAGSESGDKLTFYAQQTNNTHTITGAIYSGTTKVAETVSVNIAGASSPAWYDLTFSSPPALSAGTYRLVVGVTDQSGENADYYWDSGSGFYQANSYAGSLPGTLDLSADGVAREPSLYLTTSTGGGGNGSAVLAWFRF